MTTIPPNRIENIVRARLQMLKMLEKESDELDHHGTRGSLREEYLAKLLSELMPIGKTVASGFVVDLAGKISPQLDLIAAAADFLPPLVLGAGTSLVPIEAALAVLVVRRGFGLVGEGSSASFDLGDDLFGGLGPDEGFGVVVPV